MLLATASTQSCLTARASGACNLGICQSLLGATFLCFTQTTAVKLPRALGQQFCQVYASFGIDHQTFRQVNNLEESDLVWCAR